MRIKHHRSWLLSLLVAVGALGGPAWGQLNRQAFILLIDTSTSMKEKVPGLQDTKMMVVRGQLGEFAVNMPEGNRLTVYTFDKSPPIAGPDMVVTDAGRPDLERYFAGLHEIGQVTHAWTSLEAMLQRARLMLQEDPGLIVRVYAYTDGVDNERPRRDLEAILDQYDDILRNRDRIRVDYITLGFELGNDVAAAFARHGIGVKSALTAADFGDIQPLEADFDWSPMAIEVGDAVGFNDRSVGFVDRWAWDLGDGAASDRRYPVHVYETAGTFTVTLEVATAAGRSASKRQQLTVTAPPPAPPAAQAEEVPDPPHAMYEVDETHGRGELSVNFTNRSSGTVEQFVWDFGDGSAPVTTSGPEAVEHTFAPGRWAVSLTAQGPEGLGSDVYGPQWRIVVGAGATTTVADEPKSWTRHLIWIVPLAILLMILLLLMRRTDDD